VPASVHSARRHLKENLSKVWGLRLIVANDPVSLEVILQPSPLEPNSEVWCKVPLTSNVVMHISCALLDQSCPYTSACQIIWPLPFTGSLMLLKAFCLLADPFASLLDHKPFFQGFPVADPIASFGRSQNPLLRRLQSSQKSGPRPGPWQCWVVGAKRLTRIPFKIRPSKLRQLH
jgi:hypothetical protein